MAKSKSEVSLEGVFEHSALGIRDAQLLAIAAKAGGAFALVRLPRHDSELVAAVLDMGIDGVIAPKVSSAADAYAFASTSSPVSTFGFLAASGGQRSEIRIKVDCPSVACRSEIRGVPCVRSHKAKLTGIQGIGLT